MIINSATSMRKHGGDLARLVKPGTVIYLQGTLGAGKTTFVRGFLRGLGYLRHVRSPSFNLFEIYQIKNQIICHFDLYRLKHPEELAYIGIADFFNDENICLLEWPDHGKGFLQQADLICVFKFPKQGKGRELEIKALTPKGREMLKKNNVEI
jgi:tRNA threonylcarbamoyladenosine biosynthesis protein TsaE